MKISKNGAVVYDQIYKPTEVSYTEHSGDRVVLATNMPALTAVNLGGIETGEKLLLVTDKAINVSLNGTGASWEVGKCLLLDGGSFTSLYVQNTSTAVEATIEFIVTD